MWLLYQTGTFSTGVHCSPLEIKACLAMASGKELPSGAGEMYSGQMSSVDEIRTAIERLPKKELTRFRRWFVRYDAELWDQQIEEDVAAGKLDALARAALRDHRAKRTKPL